MNPDSRNVTPVPTPGQADSSERQVVGLHLYPFKSAAGIEVDAVEVDEVGVRDDRRWMAVDPSGSFISQRTHPRMALIRTRLRADSLELTGPDGREFLLDREAPHPKEYESLRVWFSDRYAVDCGDDAARWISEVLGESARVVRAVRPEGQPQLNEEGRVRAGFADASPALVASVASLQELNRRLDESLPMNRFRPNIVVTGFRPHGEDDWGTRTIGRVLTTGRNPCPRCATTLVDQATGERGVEPLKTLAEYRRNAKGEVDFGMNITFRGAGTIRVGDSVGEPVEDSGAE